MDLEFSAEENRFRSDVQAFLQSSLPAHISNKVRNGIRLTRADLHDWHCILNAKGWLAAHWPIEYGGTGWTPTEKYIFETECALGGAPRIVPFGVNMLAPVVIKYGTEQQKHRWLPRILDGSDWWCQGYSEPGSGSDLASVRTSAVRQIDSRGEHYIVNGQKTWTTLGHYANKIFCLVRTCSEGRKQEGISFLLIDMESEGVDVRPIITLDGEHEVNEVFFSDVRVPAENLIGEEDKGWTYAKYLLTYERTNIAGVGLSVALLDRLKRIAKSQTLRGRPLIEDPYFAARVARVEIELENMKTTNLRVIAAATSGGAPGAESSMLKIKSTEIRQEISSLMRRALGPYALPYIEEALHGDDVAGVGPAGASSVTPLYLNNRKLSIYGGSNEIQKNIISRSILGL
ncbi:acyl-CoA dehydrogenase family protein [Paraburkholderia dipogonis]|uniref:Acyl-CoA dehydrogenase family protein n=1 Tax=Paraburkholderia dipogonis TaxID=1211383 RepID=A0ABW9B7P9_9BURK